LRHGVSPWLWMGRTIHVCAWNLLNKQVKPRKDAHLEL
jgi:hypothetical protein